MAKKYLDDTGLAHLWAKIKAYVSSHSSYTLPTASDTELGGVKAPLKGTNDTRQVSIDSDGYLWTEQDPQYELPVATYTRLGGVMASVDVCPMPERRQGLCIEPSGKAWVPKLVPATDTLLGGVKAPAKTESETEQVHIDDDGFLWVQPSSGDLVAITNAEIDAIAV